MMRICTGFAIGCGAFLMMSWAPADEKAKPFQNTKEEVTLTELTNAERKKDEKSGLVLNPALSKIARAHAEIMKLWMASESHRKNILFPEFTQIGIGIARAKNGDLYFTQVFAKPAE